MMQAAGPSALGGRRFLEDSRFRVLVAALGVALLYYLGAKAGMALTPQRLPISLLWLPNALLMAVLLLTPVRRWPWFVAAVFPAHLLAEVQAGVPTSMVLGWFVSNCSEALLGAGLTLALFRRTPAFDSFKTVGLILLCAGLLAPVASSLLDAALVKAIGWGSTPYWELVRRRASSNVLSAMVVVPLVLTWAQGFRQALQAPRRRYVEAALLFAGLFAVSVLLFRAGEPDAQDAPALFYAPLPFLLWAAVRLGPMGVTSAVAVMTAAAMWGVIEGHGPFLGRSALDNAKAVQLFLIAAAVPLLLLTALLEERRRAEREAREQRRQLAHLSRVATLSGLSGAIAHELNQPLTAILANAQAGQQLLASGRADANELGEILSDITTSDRRAAEVIARLRALLKDGESQLQPLDVNALVRESLELAHGDFAVRHVRVLTQLEPALPSVRADRIQLQQVLLNLAVNACEAMSAGPIDKRVLTVRTHRAAGGAQISFIDRGPGISEADCERIFAPFYTTKPQGLGLGLSISRSIVAGHGGRLWAESGGKGAAFHVFLPAADKPARMRPLSNRLGSPQVLQ